MDLAKEHARYCIQWKCRQIPQKDAFTWSELTSSWQPSKAKIQWCKTTMQTPRSWRHQIKLMKIPPCGLTAELRPLGLVILCRARAASQRGAVLTEMFSNTFSAQQNVMERHRKVFLSVNCTEPFYFVDWTSLGVFEILTHTVELLWTFLIKLIPPDP